MLSEKPAGPGWRPLSSWAIPLAFVLVFLKVEFQPSLSVHGANADPADLAILLAVVCALLRLRDEGLASLRSARPLWIAALAFILFITAACFYPRLSDAHYAWSTHLVTDAKFTEYALLAPATAVLVRTARDAARLLGTVVAVTCAAALVGILQFVGVGIFRAWPSGSRQPSFTGIAPLGALAGAALAIGFAGLLWPGSVERRTLVAALVAGSLALVVSGEAAGGVGLAAIAVGSILVVRRRRRVSRRQVGGVAAVTAACALGLLALRGGDVTQFGRFLGILTPNRATTQNVQTYAQRTLMYYIGLRVFEAHPLLGAGWQSVREQQVYAPFLAAAHRRFRSQPLLAFPSPAHPWGLDDAYIESLAELGLLGTAVFLCMLATALVLGVRRTLRGPPEPSRLALLGLLWLLVAMGIWTGQGLVAGIGFEALAWFGIGLVGAGLMGSGAGGRSLAV